MRSMSSTNAEAMAISSLMAVMTVSNEIRTIFSVFLFKYDAYLWCLTLLMWHVYGVCVEGEALPSLLKICFGEAASMAVTSRCGL